MTHILTKQTLILLALGSSSSAALVSSGQVEYELLATLADGGVLAGAFTLDLSAPASSTTPFYTQYPIADFSISLTNSTLLFGTDRGSVTQLDLWQSSESGRQDLFIMVLADTSSSNAFGSIEFSPFSGENVILAPIEGSFSGGYLDGAGSSLFESVSVNAIPEPSGFMLGIPAIGFLLRRRRA